MGEKSTIRKPRGENILYQKGDLDVVLEKMLACPAANTFTKGAAIKYLIEGVKKMQVRGHSLEAIADFLSKENIKITTGTLKSYLAKIQKESPADKNEPNNKRKPGRKKKATETQASENINQHVDNSDVPRGTNEITKKETESTTESQHQDNSDQSESVVSHRKQSKSLSKFNK